MSKFLDQAAIQQFDAEVKHAYQAGEKLRKTVRQRTGVVGSSHRFPKMGKGLATPRIPQTDVTPMNITHTNATATLEDWNAAEFTDIFNQAKVNFDERQQLATTIAGAINRRMDQLVIDALDGAATSLTVATSIGGTNTGLNPAKLRRTSRLLSDGGVPEEDRTFVGSYVGREQLLGETEATSADYNTVLRLTSGDFKENDTFVGFKYQWIESRDEGGLDLTSNVRTNFGYHKESTGLAVGMDFRTEVNYIPLKTSWLSNGMFSAGAIGIDAEGIVECSTYEA